MKKSISNIIFRDLKDEAEVEMSSSRKTKSLGHFWIAILLFTLAALITIIFAIVQNEVMFFEGAEWDNNDSIALTRAYFIGLWTVVLSLLTSTYGFWRQCLSSSSMSSFDELSASLVSANGAICFFCFVMFISFEIFEVGIEDGVGSVFFFALFNLILSFLYTAVNLKTLGSTTRSHVDSTSLI